MSFDYDRTIAAARTRAAVPVARPSFELLVETSRRRRRARIARAALAWLLAALVVATWLASSVRHPLVTATCPWVSGPDVLRYGVVHVVGFCVGAALFGVGRTWARLLVRASWWSSLLAGTVGLWTEIGTLPVLMPTMVVAAAAGLLLLEGAQVADDSRGFPLRVHRRAILAMLTLAVADVETLLSAAMNHDEPGVGSFAATDLGFALILAVGIAGLYRLRAWGLLLVLAANVAVATAAWAGVLIYDEGFAALLTTTAACQLLLGVPLLRTLWRGDVPLRRGRRWGVWPARVVLASCFVVSALGVVRGLQPERLAAACAED